MLKDVNTTGTAKIDNKKYDEVLEILVKKMKELGNTGTSMYSQDVKVCEAMKELAIAIGIIGRLTTGNAVLDEVTQQLKDYGL